MSSDAIPFVVKSMFYMNGVQWELIKVKPNSRYLMRSDGTQTLGVTDANMHSVYLNNMLRGRLLDKVISHELCHVASFSYGLSMDIETEEIVADFLATYGREIFEVADEILERFSRVS